MAKQPILTVNINSQQFQQFTQQFNQFAGQIKNLNAQFNQINVTLQKSSIVGRALNSVMSGLLSTVKSIGSEVWKITKSFISWGTIVGGITALLGMGGGLFGIERLASSILAKRRMTLGLGQDYGQTQASNIFKQSVIGSPQGVMENIRLGQAGSPDQLRALISMGIPFGSKSSPDEIMNQIVAKLPAILNQAGPGLELQMAKAYGLDKIFNDPMDLLRLSTKEGQEEYKARQKLVEKYKDQISIAPKVQLAWTEFSMQLQAAGAQMQKVFGEGLLALANPLKHLSDSFAHLMRIFLDSPAVQQVIKTLSEWIDKLAAKMQKLTVTDIDNFISKIKEWLPTMDQLKNAMADFVAVLKGAVEVLKFMANPEQYIREHLKSKDTPDIAPPRWGTPGAPATPPTGIDTIKKWLAPTPPVTTGPSSSNGDPFSPGASNPFQFNTGVPGIPGGGFGGNPTVGAGGAFSGMPFTSIPGGGGAGLGPPGVHIVPPGTKSESQPLWSGAARSMIPKSQGFPGSDVQNAPERQSRVGPGPLSASNWQSSRTSSLVVRNVPGANIFLTAAGMTA